MKVTEGWTCRLPLALLSLVFCRTAVAQFTLGPSPVAGDGSNTGIGFGVGASSMLIVIGLSVMSVIMAVLVVVGSVARARRIRMSRRVVTGAITRSGPSSRPLSDSNKPHIDGGLVAAEAGTSPVLPVPPGPIPILVMQPNGTDVACAYEVKLDEGEDSSLKNEKSTPADSDAGVTGTHFNTTPDPTCHVGTRFPPV